MDLRALTAHNSLIPPAGLVMFHALASPAKLFFKGQFLWYSQVSRYILLESNKVAKKYLWNEQIIKQKSSTTSDIAAITNLQKKTEIWHVLDCILEEKSNCLKESLLS